MVATLATSRKRCSKSQRFSKIAIACHFKPEAQIVFFARHYVPVKVATGSRGSSGRKPLLTSRFDGCRPLPPSFSPAHPSASAYLLLVSPH